MFPDPTTRCRTSNGARGFLPYRDYVRVRGRLLPLLPVLLFRNGRIFASAVALTDHLSLLQRFLLGTLESLLGLVGLFFNRTRLGKMLLRFIILTCRRFIPFTFVR